MNVRNPSFAIDRIEASNRDAVDGLSAIALALDHGLVGTSDTKRGWFVDGLAITMGWLVLLAVILYPGLQLAAVAVCGGLMCARSIIRFILGPSAEDHWAEFNSAGRLTAPGQLA